MAERKSKSYGITGSREVESLESYYVYSRICGEASFASHQLASVLASPATRAGEILVSDRETLDYIENWKNAAAARALIFGDRILVERIWGKPRTLMVGGEIKGGVLVGTDAHTNGGELPNF